MNIIVLRKGKRQEARGKRQEARVNQALHKCGMILIVWWNGHLGGMGILVELASWWNWHLGGTGILPVSIYFRAGRMPTPLIFIRRLSNAEGFSAALLFPFAFCLLPLALKRCSAVLGVSPMSDCIKTRISNIPKMLLIIAISLLIFYPST
ncbi:hypothetical protein BJP34_15765 [Moorena producens PAL-8-15-08-1]|uniref:Uncharacterized protein n=1 Tax=Moorena producens PAL-8-15-08-1 TaxID=1458985 RepID=A0A1D8TTA9_9CYAN|nr:hypothetical protein BJP34_15765 [Moorena producens PAL-8-15-08-1]